MGIKHTECQLDSVIDYFADGFEDTDECELVRRPDGSPMREWFIDPVKGVVIFRMFTVDEKGPATDG